MTVGSFLADTNIISEIMKRKRDAALIGWLRRGQRLLISTPVILEIEWGIWSVSRHNPDEGARLRGWLNLLLTIAGDEILTSSAETLNLQAQMMVKPELSHLWQQPQGKRRRPPAQDAAIAAIAIAHHLPIATHNTKDFLRINAHFPLPGVYSPAARSWTVPRVPRSPLRRAQLALVHASPLDLLPKSAPVGVPWTLSTEKALNFV
jgi:predicted nucleic acid-binding protein